jgi:predicted nucleic acid-binding protein
MKLVIDTNLLFSAVIKPDGQIAEIIMNPKFELQIIGCYFSHIELFKHKTKMLNASKLDETELLEVMYQIIKRVEFINEKTIPIEILKKAYNLCKGIDDKDTIFIAMAEFLNCKVWSGDITLINGLRNKGYKNIINTKELLEIIFQKS